MYGETHRIFSREYFCLPDIAPIREIYGLRIFFDLGYPSTKLSEISDKGQDLIAID